MKVMLITIRCTLDALQEDVKPARQGESRNKCDETRPACQNCVKTNRECPGLPTEADLIFRTVSPGTKRKTKSRSRKGSQDTESGGSQSLSPDIEAQKSQIEQPLIWTNDGQHNRNATEAIAWTLIAAGQTVPPRTQTRPISLPDKQATASTQEIYIPPPQSEATSKDFLDVLRPLLSLCHGDSPLKLATQAVSLSNMAKQPSCRHLSAQAQNQYTRALHALQEDLKNPSLALSDSTLLTVLTFALYELSTSSDMTGWAKHMDGAITLLKARGLEQLNESSSYRMFRAIRGQILAGVGPQAQQAFGKIGFGACMEDDGSANRVAMRIRQILSGYQEYLQRVDFRHSEKNFV